MSRVFTSVPYASACDTKFSLVLRPGTSEAPGQRLPGSAGWRFGDVCSPHGSRGSRHHKAHTAGVAAPSPGQLLSRLALRKCREVPAFAGMTGVHVTIKRPPRVVLCHPPRSHSPGWRSAWDERGGASTFACAKNDTPYGRQRLSPPNTCLHRRAGWCRSRTGTRSRCRARCSGWLGQTAGRSG